MRNLFLPGLMIGALCSCGDGPTIKMEAGSNAHCTPDDLNDAQRVCLEFGGDFEGETSLTTVADCEVEMSVGLEGIKGLSGECYFLGDGKCRMKCDLPESNDNDGDGDEGGGDSADPE